MCVSSSYALGIGNPPFLIPKGERKTWVLVGFEMQAQVVQVGLLRIAYVGSAFFTLPLTSCHKSLFLFPGKRTSAAEFAALGRISKSKNQPMDE